VSQVTNDDFLEVLRRIVREAMELQDAGRLLDPVSRTEVTLLQHQLRVMEARLAAHTTPSPSASIERVAAVRDWARAVSAAAVVARSHSRRVRKDIYRTRVITGSGGD
jgi:hypothetical protein